MTGYVIDELERIININFNSLCKCNLIMILKRKNQTKKYGLLLCNNL